MDSIMDQTGTGKIGHLIGHFLEITPIGDIPHQSAIATVPGRHQVLRFAAI
jgi:hypothetical protein